MRQRRKVVISVVAVIVAALFAGKVATAKGPFVKVTIRGCYLPPRFEVTDSSLLDFFSFSEFYKAHAQAPSTVREGYEITRYMLDDSRTPIAWDRLHYYPDNGGSGGYVFYDGLIGGGSEYDRKWYRASASGDAAIRNLLAAQAITACELF